jgi:hypothetical protein
MAGVPSVVRSGLSSALRAVVVADQKMTLSRCLQNSLMEINFVSLAWFSLCAGAPPERTFPRIHSTHGLAKKRAQNPSWKCNLEKPNHSSHSLPNSCQSLRSQFSLAVAFLAQTIFSERTRTTTDAVSVAGSSIAATTCSSCCLGCLRPDVDPRRHPSTGNGSLRHEYCSVSSTLRTI